MRTWPADAIEGLDDEHAGAAARTGARMHGCGLDGCRISFTAQIIVGRIDDIHTQQRVRLGEVRLALPIGEKAVVPDAVQAFRQHVDQEATHELVGRQVIVVYRAGPSTL